MADVVVDSGDLEALRWEAVDNANKVELLSERFSDSLFNSLDNIGWAPLQGTATGQRGPKLNQLHWIAMHCRTMFAANPMAQQGVEIRTGYIWGTGIELTSGSNRTDGIPSLTKANQGSLFSSRAQIELEAAAATDGNVFMVLDKNKKKAIRIAMEEITAVMSDPDDANTIIFYKRIWTYENTDTAGNVSVENKEMWYAAHDYSGPRPPMFVTTPVAKPNFAMIHAAFNTRSAAGSTGVPDLFNVTWWLSSYKEYIEAGFSVTKALARFAVKSTSPSKAGMNRAAAKMSVTGAADGGVTPGYGQAVNLSGGMDVSAISKSGAEFDFSSGRAIAAMTAMGLGIDVDALLAENKLIGDNQLTPSTVKRMVKRQGIWDDFLSSIAVFFGVANPNIQFPPVRTVAVHRAIQAVATAAATGVLFPEEVRDITLGLRAEYGVDPLPGMPKAGQWAKFAAPVPPPAPAPAPQPNDGQGAGGDPAHPGTTPQKTPNATTKNTKKKTPAGPLADGDNEAEGIEQMSAHLVKFGRSPLIYWENYLQWVVDLGLLPADLVAGDALISDDASEVTFWAFDFEPGTRQKILGPGSLCAHCGHGTQEQDGHLHPQRHQVTVPLLKDPKEYNLVVLAIRPQERTIPAP